MKAQSVDAGRWSRLRGVPWSLGIAAGLIAFFTPHPEWHQDLEVFRNAYETLRHPYWARWLYQFLAALPEPIAFLGLTILSTACLYLAVRFFGGRHWMVFTSFAFAWVLFYGQIDGLIVGGLALVWWALENDRPILMGAGFVLASIKPQLSLPLMLAMWWWSPSRLRPLVIPAVVFALTLIQFGWWVPGWVESLFQTGDLVWLSRNISLWSVIGPWAVAIWPVVALIRMPRHRKLMLIAVATALSMPYFPLPSAVLLLAMPVPWWGYILAQVPALAGIFGDWANLAGRLLPPLLFIWLVWPQARAWLISRRSQPDEAPVFPK